MQASSIHQTSPPEAFPAKTYEMPTHEELLKQASYRKIVLPLRRSSSTPSLANALKNIDFGEGSLLHPGTFVRPKKSCMVFATQEESLESIDLSADESTVFSTPETFTSGHKRIQSLPHLSSIMDGAEIGRKVCFDSIHVREYERKLGEQPCSSGPPLTLGWNVVRASDCPIDEYEKRRLTEGRGKTALLVPGPEREKILMRRGYRLDEMRKAMRIGAQVQRERSQSAASSETSMSTKFEEIAERASRKISKLLRTSHKRKEERKILENARKRDELVSRYNWLHKLHPSIHVTDEQTHVKCKTPPEMSFPADIAAGIGSVDTQDCTAGPDELQWGFGLHEL